MTHAFTTADADRLLSFADRYLEDWAKDAIQAGERDEVYEERNAEWLAIRPLLVAAPHLLSALEDIWQLQHDGYTDEEWDAAWARAETVMDEARGRA